MNHRVTVMAVVFVLILSGCGNNSDKLEPIPQEEGTVVLDSETSSEDSIISEENVEIPEATSYADYIYEQRKHSQKTATIIEGTKDVTEKKQDIYYNETKGDTESEPDQETEESFSGEETEPLDGNLRER